MAFPGGVELLAGSGPLGSLSGLVALAGTVVLLLIVAAIGGIAYRSLKGDGIEWPGETDEDDSPDEGVRRGRTDDEWKYY